MGNVLILTDNSAQFPTASFPGHDLVHVIPIHVQINEERFKSGKGIRPHDLPPTTRFGLDPSVHPPTVEEFRQMFAYLGQFGEEIVALLASSQLATVTSAAEAAAEMARGRVEIHVVDSQTTAVGLGLLTQAAAQAASAGLSGADIVRQLRGLIPHVYSMFCIPGLSYLHQAGLLGQAQALVGEKLGVMPLYIMEAGQLVPILKARSSRHLVDCLHEFVGEFSNIQHIAIMQGVPAYEQEVRSLRERFSLDFGDVPVSEHTIGAALAALLGPHTLGVFVMEEVVPE